MSEGKRSQMSRRNVEICAYYQAGHELNECTMKFALGRQRVRQILRKAGLWHLRERTVRTKFLGAFISEPTKVALRQKARQKGVSVSRLTSDVLEESLRRK